ncbi:hypothetical protein GOODEAATRI_025789, partial [Goodea atripinnis]
DGRQSSVVTKVFSVDQVESGIKTEDKEDGLQSCRQVIKHISLKPSILFTTLLVLLKDLQFCPQCGATIPAHKLTPAETGQVGQGRNSAPCGWAADGKMFSCSRCKRLNRSDARFCDCCGTKCGASGHPYACYCTACGVFLEGQALPKPRSDITQPKEGTTHSQVSALSPHDAAWKATPPPNSAPRLKASLPSVDQSTQTVGLYYPSATEMQKKEQQRALQSIQELATRDRRPPLTAISLGRGYWRKQLDHVCAHLRSYTQNNSSFRTLLAEPRLGQVTDYQLLKELGPDGGKIRTIQQLLDLVQPPMSSHDGPLCHLTQFNQMWLFVHQGADPSCCGSDSRHALAVAVVNGHHNILPVLVQRGADVDQQSGPCKAGVRRKNAAGQTAFDVAVNSGCNDVASLLAAQTGLDLLGKLGRSRVNLDVF